MSRRGDRYLPGSLPPRRDGDLQGVDAHAKGRREAAGSTPSSPATGCPAGQSRTPQAASASHVGQRTQALPLGCARDGLALRAASGPLDVQAQDDHLSSGRSGQCSSQAEHRHQQQAPPPATAMPSTLRASTTRSSPSPEREVDERQVRERRQPSPARRRPATPGSRGRWRQRRHHEPDARRAGRRGPTPTSATRSTVRSSTPDRPRRYRAGTTGPPGSGERLDQEHEARQHLVRAQRRPPGSRAATTYRSTRDWMAPLKVNPKNGHERRSSRADQRQPGPRPQHGNRAASAAARTHAAAVKATTSHRGIQDDARPRTG